MNGDKSINYEYSCLQKYDNFLIYSEISFLTEWPMQP